LEDLFEADAQFVVPSLTFRPASGKSYSVSLSGGSTPQRLFTRLATDPCRSQVNWSSIRIFWGDEREVPPDLSESNSRMAKENLLDRIPISPDQVFRMGEERPAQEVAVRYEEMLQPVFSHKNKEASLVLT
jgi:6-phosphogluconolactonase